MYTVFKYIPVNGPQSPTHLVIKYVWSDQYRAPASLNIYVTEYWCWKLTVSWFTHPIVLTDSPWGQAGDWSPVHGHCRGLGTVSYHTVQNKEWEFLKIVLVFFFLVSYMHSSITTHMDGISEKLLLLRRWIYEMINL